MGDAPKVPRVQEPKQGRVERFVDANGKFAFKWVYDEDKKVEPKQLVVEKVEFVAEEPKKSWKRK